jgi:hypothetical protein
MRHAGWRIVHGVLLDPPPRQNLFHMPICRVQLTHLAVAVRLIANQWLKDEPEPGVVDVEVVTPPSCPVWLIRPLIEMDELPASASLK